MSIAADYRSVLGEVDAIINALPNSLHAPVIMEALNAGVHVLCEKPLADRLPPMRGPAANWQRKKILCSRWA